MVVSLVADPGLPFELARSFAVDLDLVLSREVSDECTWQVDVVAQRLPADEQGDIRLDDLVHERIDESEIDVTVCLTDQPRRDGVRPIVGDVSTGTGVALVSLPAMGVLRVRSRAGRTVVRLVEELVGEPLGLEPPGGRADGGDLPPFRRTTPTDGDVDVRYVGGGHHSRLRLLAGMIRANRPWRLITYLSAAFAAAIAVGAYSIITPDIWVLADTLGPGRLAAAGGLSIAAMVAWLVIDHEMWERPSRPAAKELAAFYNATTVVSLTIGVLFVYAGLFVLALLTELLLLDRGLLGARLGHGAGWIDYVTVAWMASSLATVGGALGTGFQTDEAVQAAAYGYRQRERRRTEDAKAD
jgi:hypothetical protein